MTTKGRGGAQRNRARRPLGPSEGHEANRQTLETLALLTSHSVALPPAATGGLRPDVLRTDAAQRTVFLGEAKYSETPGTTETGVRLQRYFEWLVEWLGRTGGTATVAVCHSEAQDSLPWVRRLELLTREVGIDARWFQVTRIGGGTSLVWAVGCSVTTSVFCSGLIGLSPQQPSCRTPERS